MNPIPVPEAVKTARDDCRLVSMGPPAGVADDDCGTAEMLIGGQVIPGFTGRAQYAYFKPTAEELEQLNAGAVLELCQIGTVVQPFSLAVWPPAEPEQLDDEDDEDDDLDVGDRDGADLDPCNYCPHDNSDHRGDGCLYCGCVAAQ